MVIYSAEARFWDKSELPWRKITVPAPYDAATPTIDTWSTRWARNALELRKAGFGGLQFPPMLKTQSGHTDTGDGYGWDGDLDDIGTKNFNFSIPTRLGTGQELLRTVANLNAVGMQFGANIVCHQAIGDKGDGIFTFPNWKGTAGAGSTKWGPGDFRDFRGEDPVWEQPDFGFGREFVYAKASPAGYTTETMIAGWQRLLKRVGFSFARLDDVKGEYLPFVREFVKSAGLKDIRYIAEDFDGYAPKLVAWLDAMGVTNVSTYDFDTHWGMQQILAQENADLRKMNGRGLNAVRPLQACTFVDNADTDLSDGQQIISAKRRCYAWILTCEGDVQIYHKDYSTDNECYGLQEYIDPMIWCHQMFAHGETQSRCSDSGAIVLEREGGLLSAFSTDPLNVQTRTVYTAHANGTWLKSYTGQHDPVQVQNHQVTISIPSDYYGQGNSYLMFGPADPIGMKFAAHPQYTTQHVFGADDRDVAPAIGNSVVAHWPFWCAAGSKISWTFQTTDGLTFDIIQPDGTRLDRSTGIKTTGWHTLQSENSNTGDVPFEVAVTYMGTQGLTDEQAKMPVPRINVVEVNE